MCMDTLVCLLFAFGWPTSCEHTFPAEVLHAFVSLRDSIGSKPEKSEREQKFFRTNVRASINVQKVPRNMNASMMHD